MNGIARRTWLKSSALLGLAACRPAAQTRVREAPRFVGQDPSRGHLLRELGKQAPAPTHDRKVATLIVGGGAAGTAAAWWLSRHNDGDYALIELEDEVGGTARAHATPRSDFPCGAHYLPAPPAECETLLLYLREIGLITGQDPDGAWRYDPLSICAAPMERHLWRGYWHEGLYPAAAQTHGQADQWQRWQEHLRELDAMRDGSGHRLFRLPFHRSSPALTALDTLSARDYLLDRGFESWRLHWYVDYACRDDYGLRASQCSALAMLHHFLGRGLEDRPAAYTLSSARGNAPLVEGLLAKAKVGPVLGELVFRIDAASTSALSYNVQTKQVTRWQCQRIIWSAPYYALKAALALSGSESEILRYTPWLVAGVSVRQVPPGPGVSLAWDNVAIDESHLGYVVANHGASRRETDPGRVLAYYEPLLAEAGPELVQERRWLFESSLQALAQRVESSLVRMHPRLAPEIESIAIARWGHAMVRPEVGIMSQLQPLRWPAPNVECCGTDSTGLPLFEQAFYSGILAASRSMHARGLRDDAIL
jgi:predicted NAD/FAD-dependent oxidoreductase